MRSFRSLLAASLVLGTPAVASAQRPLNLDFELPSVSYPDRPWGWTLGWSAFAGGSAATFALDTAVHAHGTRSLRIELAGADTAAPPQAIMLQLPAAFARGRALHLTGLMRVRGHPGRAFALLEAWNDGAMSAADTADLRGGAAEEDWAPFQLEIAVPQDPAIHSIVISAGVDRGTTAWFDALELRLDGTPLTELPVTIGAPRGAELAWLAARSAPLFGVSPQIGTRGDADLVLFSRIVGNARVVGLGESTHGTSEFFQLKHRLLEYLVRRQGFDLFAIEANQLAVERLNAFVLRGEGTARDAMRVLFRVWNTEEVLALVEWMRAYNVSAPARPVRFVGFDMQDHRTPVDTLRAFVGRADPSFGPRVDALSGPYRAERSYATPQVAESIRAGWQAQADTLWREVSARRAQWLVEASSAADSVTIEWAVQSANLFRQAARFNASLNSPDRDSLMAANLAWSLKTLYPGSRAVLWAHDVHVSRGGDTVRSFNGGAQMGAYLRRLYGADYRAFSLLTATGRYSATRSFTDHEVVTVEAFPAPVGSVEAVLAALPEPAGAIGLVVDLRSDPADPKAAWLWQPRPLRHIGYAAYDYGFELLAVMPLEFDGVVFVNQTGPSRTLP